MVLSARDETMQFLSPLLPGAHGHKKRGVGR